MTPLAALVSAALVALSAGARTPAEAVQRFILNRTPADACAQLDAAYARKTAKQYGPCLDGMKYQPKATRLVISDVRVHGTAATLHAAYTANGRRFRELYTLRRESGGWKITGAKLLP